MHPKIGRGGFLRRAGIGLLAPLSLSDAAAASTAGDARDVDPWRGRLRGSFKQVFDVPHHYDGAFLAYVKNYFDALEGPYGVPSEQISAVVGLRGSAVALALRDETWAKYPIGLHFGIFDATGRPAGSNRYLLGGSGAAVSREASVGTLQKRGAVFLVCNNTLRRLATDLRAKAGSDVVLKELRRSIVDGAYVVPAMVAALNRAQAYGCTYSVYVA